MATRQQCIKEIQDAFKGVDRKIINNIVEHVDNLRQNATDPSQFRREVNQYFREMGRKAAIEVKNTAENAIKLQREIDFLLGDEIKAIGVERGLRSVLVGINERVTGGNKSIGQESTAIHSKALSMLRDGLETKQMIKLARSGEADKDVIKIMYNRERGLSDPTDVDARSLEIADTYSKVYNYLQDQMELAGSARNRREGYLRRAHSATKIESMGKDVWKKDMLDNMDLKAMFPNQFDDPRYIDEFLEELYERIVLDSYDRGITIQSKDDFLSMFLENKYKGMERERSILFRSAEAEVNYRQKYTDGNLLDDVVRVAQRDARAAAAMSRLGTNPRASWEALKSEAAKSTRGDRKAAVKLQSTLRRLDDMYKDTLDGFDTGTSHLAKAGSIARSISSVNTLGSSSLVAFPTDGVTNAIVYSATSGESLPASMLKVMERYTKGLSKEHRAEFYKRASIYIDNSLGEFQSRWNPADHLTGGIAKMNDIFYSVNLLRQHTEISKFTGHSLYAQLLGDNVGMDFKSLNPTLQGSLARYGITPEDWGVLRNAVEDVQGYKNITPAAIGALEKITPRQKRDLQMKVSTFLQENAENRGTPTPDNEVRSALLSGTNPDSMPGQLIRFIAHLKTFPLAIGKSISYSLLNRPDMAGLSFRQAAMTPRGMATIAKITASLTFAGMLGQMLRDLSANRKTKFDANFMTKSIIAGGSAGIYGDFLLAEYDKNYRNFAQDILGPVVGGTGVDLTTLTARMARGDAQAIQAFNLLIRNIPGNNLFYTKAALDAMILDEIREYIDPEYMMNRAKRMAREEQEPIIDF